MLVIKHVFIVVVAEVSDALADKISAFVWMWGSLNLVYWLPFISKGTESL
jgi:hypothetical protein